MAACLRCCKRQASVSSCLFVEQRIGRHVELFEAAADAVEGLIDAIRELQEIVFTAIDGAPVEHLPPIDDAIPITAAVNQDEIAALQLSGLHQGKDFPELVHGAKAAGKNNQGFGELGEPEFAHEEVVKLKIQARADVIVWPL